MNTENPTDDEPPIAQPYAKIHLWTQTPTVEDWVQKAKRRSLGAHVQAVGLAVICGFAFVALGLDSPILPLVALLTLIVPLVLWHYPRLLLYITFASVCLFEIYPVPYGDSLTDAVPFFWNMNTIFERYAKFNPKAMPFSLFEMLALVTGIFALIRSIFNGGVRLQLGPIFPYIAVYVLFVTIGWISGLARGGDFKISLMEVRAQFYFLLAYLMAVNIVTTRKQIVSLFWIAAVCIAFKGILYTARRYITLGGLPVPDQGVGSHEEAFLFNAFLILLLVLWLTGVQHMLQKFLLTFLPLVTLGNLATNRRAATAAFVIVVPAMLLSAYVTLPRRRKLAAVLGVVLSVGGTAYYQAYKNSGSMIAQPARAIRSQFAPDKRDLESNAYREAENANLLFNVKNNPLGYGYGRRMAIVVPMADISNHYQYWDIMPHNQILWVWMRVGWPGFFAFWAMICGILVYTCDVLRNPKVSMEGKAVSLYTQLTLIMLLMFGMYDLQLSNPRDMLYTGFCIGLAVIAARPGVMKEDSVELLPSEEDAPAKMQIGSSARRRRLLTGAAPRGRGGGTRVVGEQRRSAGRARVESSDAAGASS